MPNVDVVSEIVVDAPVDRVADFTMNPDNAPHWYENIESVEWLTPRPLAIGSRLAFVAHFLGRRLSYTYEITELEPGAKLVMRTAQGPFPMETNYEFQDAGAGQTRMSLRNRGEPAGFGRLMSPFIAAAMRRANRKDVEQLKRLLEASAGKETGR